VSNRPHQDYARLADQESWSEHSVGRSKKEAPTGGRG